jgi:hypothetical protein
MAEKIWEQTQLVVPRFLQLVDVKHFLKTIFRTQENLVQNNADFTIYLLMKFMAN